MSHYYTIKEIAEMSKRSKSNINAIVKQLDLVPDNQGTNKHFYNAEHTKQIILKINPCYNTAQLDKEIIEMSAAAEEIDRPPTEKEKAEREFIIKQERNRAEIAQQQMLIDMLKEQLSAKDKQIDDYNKQLAAKDIQIAAKDNQIKDLSNTINEQNKSIAEQTSIINKQAAAIAEMNTSISQAQQLTLIAQADKIKEMQREQQTTGTESKAADKADHPAADEQDTKQQSKPKGGGATSQQTEGSSKPAKKGFLDKLKFIFKK